MSRFFFLLLAICLFLPKNIDGAAPKVHSRAAILMEVESKEVLYKKNAQQNFYPGSITKLPVVLYALKKKGLKLDEYALADQDTMGSISKKFALKSNYKYPSHWLVLGGTHMQIHRGERLKINDLLHGMLLESANDASNVLVKHISGSVSQFMDELNSYLKKIGCKKTRFLNPHGLHYPKHTTTASDMAIIACEALKNDHIRKVMKTSKHVVKATNKRKERLLVNKNKLLSKKSVYYYPHAIGGKTGYHDEAKSTFVAAAKKKDKTLVVVLLNCPRGHQKYEDAIKLFEYGFNKK